MTGQHGRWRERLYGVVTGPKFPAARLAVWVLQVPPAIVYTWLAESVKYLCFLSLAALIESALTDVIEGWKHVESTQDEPA